MPQLNRRGATTGRRSDDRRRPPEEADTLNRLPTFITVDELAHVLRVNRNTAYEAVQRGDIPGVRRIGRKIRICRATVVGWLRAERRGSRIPKGTTQ